MSVRNFRRLAVVEAVSFLVLLFFSVVQRDESMIEILGPVHGVLFIAYVGMLWLLRKPAGLTPEQTLWLGIGAVVPFGGFVADWWLARRWQPPA